MPKFSYIAKTFNNEPFRGVAEVENTKDLPKFLKKQGAFFIKAEVFNEVFDSGKKGFYFQKKEILSNLSEMLYSGVSFNGALNVLSSQTHSAEIRSFLIKSSEELSRGKSFSETLSGQKNIFPKFEQELIKAAEESGNLRQAIAGLADSAEKEDATKRKIKKEYTYPMAIFSGTPLVIFLMFVFLSSKLFSYNPDALFGAKAMISTNNFLIQQWFFIIAALSAGAAILWFFSKTKNSKFFIKSRPFENSVYQKLNCARVLKNFGSLVALKIPIAKSIDIVSNNEKSPYFKEATREIGQKIKSGETLSQAFNCKRDVFPPLIAHMIEPRQQKGELALVLSELASFYETEAEESAEKTVLIFGNIFMIFLGAIAGFIVISLMQPMISVGGIF